MPNDGDAALRRVWQLVQHAHGQRGVTADVLQRPVHRVANPQFCGVRGAAVIALRALGEIPRLEDTGHLVEVTDRFEPRAAYASLYDERYAAYRDYYDRTHSWFRRLNEGRTKK